MRRTMFLLLLAGITGFSTRSQAQSGTFQIINQTGCKFDFYEIYATCSGNPGFFVAAVSVPPNSVSPLYIYPFLTPPPPPPPPVLVPFPTPLVAPPAPPPVPANSINYVVCKVNGPLGENFAIGPSSANPTTYTSVQIPPCNGGTNHYTVVWTNPNANNVVVYILP